MNTQKIPFVSLFVVLVVSLTMIGCSSSASGPNDDGNGNGNGGPAPSVVGMSSQSFSPANIEVKVGTTVKWTNGSNVVHTVTSGTNGEHDDKFDSGNIAPGEEYSYQFTEIGEYPYFCIPHVSNGMTGTVTVVENNNSNGY
ncbi:MAG TPA: plastocyanin/azurin family copper-binding protein [Gracilimonas sp.]|uniref:cupredoxin domain-containing protein n=1 Tax=Gracilimonas sp. TaxID=1974203 RepID=UPI002D984E3F|nr:plastocyanin/azurin family copper-binding protein [Gracilimonas sp.]